MGIRKVIFEDHSAKTFNRPEWVKLLADLKKYKGKSDLILFTKPENIKMHSKHFAE
ncbi:MAG: recombinase family protein [Segetibacter sp.]